MYFTNEEQFTKYGYFEVNGIKTFSKYEAWKIAQQQNLPTSSIKFIFNDKLMEELNWAQEPTESIEELYKQRAQQLRDNYDHVVLLYSGGIDSHVILNTFVKNGIKIDEIVVAGNRQFQPDTAKINQEVVAKALPYLETLNLEQLGTKFTYVDIGQIELDQFMDDDFLRNFMYYYNGPLSPWCIALRGFFFKLKNEHQIELAKEGKKICYMWGYDKPNLFEINGHWCFRFTDSVSEYSVRPYHYKKDIGGVLAQFYDEPFFVTPDAPKIVIKQCHMLVNMINSIRSLDDERIADVGNVPNTGPFIEHPLGKGYVNGKWVKKKEIERVIYPDENPDEFGDDKVRGSVMFTARDNWFFRGTTESRNRLMKTWKRILREDEGYFKYNIEGFPLNSLTFYSRPYTIGLVK